MLDKPDILSIIKAAGFQPIRRGSRLFILCPFHPDKNPSCLINTERQIFHCFACSAHGDVIDFVMELKGFSFPEACDYLRIKSKGSSNRSNKAKRKIKRLTPEEKFHVEFAHLLRLRNEVVFRAAFDEWLTNRLSFLSEIIDKLERTLEAISEILQTFDMLYLDLQRWKAEREILANGSLTEKLAIAERDPCWRLVLLYLKQRSKK